jgi:hypothetical protein
LARLRPAAILMDLMSLGMYALHVASVIYR